MIEQQACLDHNQSLMIPYDTDNSGSQQLVQRCPPGPGVDGGIDAASVEFFGRRLRTPWVLADAIQECREMGGMENYSGTTRYSG